MFHRKLEREGPRPTNFVGTGHEATHGGGLRHFVPASFCRVETMVSPSVPG